MSELFGPEWGKRLTTREVIGLVDGLIEKAKHAESVGRTCLEVDPAQLALMLLATKMELESQEWEIEWSMHTEQLTPLLAEHGLRWDGERFSPSDPGVEAGQ